MRTIIRFVLGVAFSLAAAGQVSALPFTWQTIRLGFRVAGITTKSGSFWICGAGGAIASSSDGEHWQIRHQHEAAGPLLLGIGFTSPSFGYAYGVSGAVLTTDDGGDTWIAHPVESGTILHASFSAPYFGIVRTRDKLLVFHGSPTPREVPNQDRVLTRFPYAYGVAALSAERLGALVKEGEYSEGSFLSTTDGGVTWTIYDPPSSGIRSFLSVDGHYWAVGHEVVKGLGVPLAMSSEDGTNWSRTTKNIHACHWEVCTSCNTSGCIASSTLLVDPFHGPTTYASVPEEGLTWNWAQVAGSVCTLNYGLRCVAAATPKDVEAQPAVPSPRTEGLPRLGAPAITVMGLVCIECTVDRSLTEPRQSTNLIHADLVVGMDGSIKSAQIKGAPKVLKQTVQEQVEDWLFEPPRRDGKPIEVSITKEFGIAVPR